AVRLLAWLSVENAGMFREMQKLIQTTEFDSVGRAAIEYVAKHGTHLNHVRDWLINRAVHARSDFVRMECLEALATNWSRDKTILKLLRRAAKSDENESIRDKALALVAKNWNEDQEVLEWLKLRVLKHDENMIIIIRHIAENFRDEATLKWLKSCIELQN